MDYSALDAIAKVAGEYKANGKNLHLRFLSEECHRVLAKGRGLMQDVASVRVRAPTLLRTSHCVFPGTGCVDAITS